MKWFVGFGVLAASLLAGGASARADAFDDVEMFLLDQRGERPQALTAPHGAALRVHDREEVTYGTQYGRWGQSRAFVLELGGARSTSIRVTPLEISRQFEVEHGAGPRRTTVRVDPDALLPLLDAVAGVRLAAGAVVEQGRAARPGPEAPHRSFARETTMYVQPRPPRTQTWEAFKRSIPTPREPIRFDDVEAFFDQWQRRNEDWSRSPFVVDDPHPWGPAVGTPEAHIQRFFEFGETPGITIELGRAAPGVKNLFTIRPSRARGRFAVTHRRDERGWPASFATRTPTEKVTVELPPHQVLPYLEWLAGIKLKPGVELPRGAPPRPPHRNEMSVRSAADPTQFIRVPLGKAEVGADDALMPSTLVGDDPEGAEQMARRVRRALRDRGPSDLTTADFEREAGVVVPPSPGAVAQPPAKVPLRARLGYLKGRRQLPAPGAPVETTVHLDDVAGLRRLDRGGAQIVEIDRASGGVEWLTGPVQVRAQRSAARGGGLASFDLAPRGHLDPDHVARAIDAQPPVPRPGRPARRTR